MNMIYLKIKVVLCEKFNVFSVQLHIHWEVEKFHVIYSIKGALPEPKLSKSF